MKNLVRFIFIFLVYSCSKNKSNPSTTSLQTTNCPEMYLQRSIAYVNPYKGTLQTGSVFGPDLIYPDKYNYSQPCVNPNNEFEFCYLRRENGVQLDDDLDLFKYNFCTGKTKLIANHVVMMPDWSVNDWIVFTGTNRNIWKVKSNGDSLTEFGISGYRSRWNSSGTKFIFNGNQIADKNGTLIQTLNIPANFNSWMNDSILIYNINNNSTDNFEISELNINTGVQKSIYSEPKNGTGSITRYNQKSNNIYYMVTNQDTLKSASLDLTTMKIVTIGKSKFSFIQNNFFDVQDNKVILQQILSDTMTGSPTYLNYRSHIAIMEKDGSNLRHIIIPE